MCFFDITALQYVLLTFATVVNLLVHSKNNCTWVKCVMTEKYFQCQSREIEHFVSTDSMFQKPF